ncbi:MAG: MerR family transcriptional regulator [Lysobacter sp.]|nr:MerR family transcriptional regulator [Lysobacter sp.]
MPSIALTVGRVAASTSLTIRALHHYDAIGLVRPSHRSQAGYRLYTEQDLRRLQQVLVFRELGFGLDEVRALIDAPPERRREALLAQRTALLQRRQHADAVLEAVDATLHALETNAPMTTDSLFRGTYRFANGEYGQEAERRWGEGDAWKTARKRTGGYSKEDWARIEQEAETISTEFLAAMQQNLPADHATTRALAEHHRSHIDRWFYPCSPALHTQVASLYTADPRFQAHYDRHAEGLAAYIESAIRANAEAIIAGDADADARE